MMNDFSAVISIYNAILNYIHQRGLEDYDDFSWKFTEKVVKEFQNRDFDVERITRKLSTSFFKMNSIKREDFYSGDFAVLVKKMWRKPKRVQHPLKGSNKQAIDHLTQTQKARGSYKQVYIDEIDSFRESRSVSTESVANLVPLRVKEAQIKTWLADIIGEPFTQKDWGGEPNDLFSNRVRFRRKRVPTAFLLKGPGVKGHLTISKCGKNGDQILRLVKAYSARLFIVQYVNKIHPSVIDSLEAHVAYESMKGKKLSYCVMDGVDTARVFRAYGRL